MRNEGIDPDVVTYICVLKACCSICCLQVGEEIYDEVKDLGLCLETHWQTCIPNAGRFLKHMKYLKSSLPGYNLMECIDYRVCSNG